MKAKHFNDLSIYLDESGSSGGNFLDSNQPYFVQGGLILETSNVPHVEKIFREWELKYLQPKQVEIKSNKLFKNSNGFRIFEELFMSLSSFILCPTYAILHKKYALCFSSVEAFLDSHYNLSLTNEDFFWKGNREKWVEIFFHNFSINTFKLLNDTILNKSYKSLVEAQQQIRIDLDKNYNELALKIQACPTEEAFNFLIQNSKNISSNSICFNSHMFSLKRELSKNPPQICRIFHDEQNYYSSHFEEVFDVINTGPVQVAPIGLSKTIIWGKIGNWQLNFEKSQNTALIRIADLICGYVANTLRSVEERGHIGGSSQALFNLFWLPILRNQNEKFKDLPHWNYEGIPENLFLKLCENIKA